MRESNLAVIFADALAPAPTTAIPAGRGRAHQIFDVVRWQKAMKPHSTLFRIVHLDETWAMIRCESPHALNHGRHFEADLSDLEAVTL